MAEYVKKEDVLALAEKADVNESFDEEIIFAYDVRELSPATDVRENKQGSWITDSDGLFICSECEEPAPQRMMFHPKPFCWTCEVMLTNFCPRCGAEMFPEKLRGKWTNGTC